LPDPVLARQIAGMMILHLRNAMVVGLLMLVSAFCLAADVNFPRSKLELVSVAGQRHSFDVELASTPEQLSQGLMFRRNLAANAGMLFDFGQIRPVSMWMRNTLIPLDMLFIDDRGQVVAVVQRTVPMSEEPLGPTTPVRAVLELNGGTASRLGIGPGTTVRHPIFKGQ
jgi:uncharacterized membrane protein (UPF0127 family)